MMSTMEKVLYLRQLDLFRDFGGEELSAIASIVSEASVSKGDTLIRRDDPGDALYLIVEGQIGVIKLVRGEEKMVAIMGPEECVGEMAILGDQARTATIQALEPCRLLKIAREDFCALIRKRPEMAFVLFRILLARINEMAEELSKQ